MILNKLITAGFNSFQKRKNDYHRIYFADASSEVARRAMGAAAEQYIPMTKTALDLLGKSFEGGSLAKIVTVGGALAFGKELLVASLAVDALVNTVRTTRYGLDKILPHIHIIDWTKSAVNGVLDGSKWAGNKAVDYLWQGTGKAALVPLATGLIDTSIGGARLAANMPGDIGRAGMGVLNNLAGWGTRLTGLTIISDKAKQFADKRISAGDGYFKNITAFETIGDTIDSIKSSTLYGVSNAIGAPLNLVGATGIASKVDQTAGELSKTSLISTIFGKDDFKKNKLSNRLFGAKKQE